MARCNVIVIGASAGGVGSIVRLVSQFRVEMPAAVAVSMHFPETSPSLLPAILARSGPMPSRHPRDEEPLLHGQIYVAPPGRHLLVKRNHVRVVVGPHENGHRPAVDPLFRTAARAHRTRAVGVILSGNLDDGTAGLAAIKSRGGTAIVQDPADAHFAGMPRSAIENVDVDFVGDIDAIAAELTRIVDRLAADTGAIHMDDGADEELDAVEMDSGIPDPDTWTAAPSQFTCPECHGSLWELHEGTLVRYRCRTGHAFGPETLASEQVHAIEQALWTALRALQENSALLRRLHERARGRGQTRVAERFLAEARDIEERAHVIRAALERGGATIDAT